MFCTCYSVGQYCYLFTHIEYSDQTIFFVSTLHNFIPFFIFNKLSTYKKFCQHLFFLFVFKYLILLHSGIKKMNYLKTNVNGFIRIKGVSILYGVLILGYVSTVFSRLLQTIVFTYLYFLKTPTVYLCPH